MSDVFEQVQRLAAPLHDGSDLDPLIERTGDARFVLLGEASHGTHEFYSWRAAITRRLVTEKGFGFVAVEADWPDCYQLNRSVIGAPDAPQDPANVLRGFDRWPPWMWANEEVVTFTRWLRKHNAERTASQRVGFHGLDVYSLWDSLRGILGYLREHEPAHVESVLAAFRCFEPYAEDPQAYARATRLVPNSCESPVLEMLTDLRRVAGRGDAAPDARFNAEQNALVAAGVEAYYRAMVAGGPAPWNVRDHHMADTLDRLVAHHGEAGGGAPVKAVVWEHNTHVGDARCTDMPEAGLVNVGQLVRERHGEDGVVLVGFGTHSGSVVAADAWGDPAQVTTVPELRREGAASRHCCTTASRHPRPCSSFPPNSRLALRVARPSGDRGSSTGRAPSGGATTSRRCWAAGTTPRAGLTRPGRWPRFRAPTPPAENRRPGPRAGDPQQAPGCVRHHGRCNHPVAGRSGGGVCGRIQETRLRPAPRSL